MRKLLLLLLLSAVAGTVRAAPDFVDTAEVVSATPIVERVTESRQECDPAPIGEPAPAAPKCRTVRVPRDVVKAYTVIYRYGGREITTTLPYDPGPTARVGVSIVDAPSRPVSPTAGMLGTNVREVTRPAPPPASAPSPAPDSKPGGYPYRY
jgi:hypothetical protein